MWAWTGGSIICWEFGPVGGAYERSGEFTDVSAEQWHECAVRADKTITCWLQVDVQLADRDTARHVTDGQFTDVSTGAYQTCGLRTDRTVVCWDSALTGEVESPEGLFTAITSGYGHSCGVRTDSAVVCWGDNEAGQADAPDGRFSAVGAGADHSCAVTVEAAIVCWGQNLWGQNDAPPGRFTAVAAGSDHSCGLHTDGTVECWDRTPGGRLMRPGAVHRCGRRLPALVRLAHRRNRRMLGRPLPGPHRQRTLGQRCRRRRERLHVRGHSGR